MAVCKPRVAIIGAGVIGLSVGGCLAETYGKQLDLTIIADKFTPDTTSDGAGGLFESYTLGFSRSAARDLQRWTTETFHYLQRLYESGIQDEIGLSVVTGYSIFSKEQPLPWCKDLLFDFKALKNQSLEAALDLPSRPGGVSQGDSMANHTSKYLRKQNLTVWKYKTFVIEGKKYLPWLMKKFQSLGGLILRHKVDSLQELGNYDIIINCTGLGARELVGDKSVYPIRGQVVTMNVPSFGKYYDITDEDNLLSVIPHKDYVILGNTTDVNNWSKIPDPKTREEMLHRFYDLLPWLREAEVVGGWACLRPARREVRLELENSGTSPPVIHCYGHSGQGYVLHWGCVQDVMKLMQKCLKGENLVARLIKARL